MPPPAQQLAFIPELPRSTKQTRQREQAPAPVQLYKRIVGRWPHRSTWPTIEKAIRNGNEAPTSNDMTRWADTVKTWLAVGYNPMNVAGMLDCYRRDVLPDPARHAQGPPDEPAGFAGLRQWLAQKEKGDDQP